QIPGYFSAFGFLVDFMPCSAPLRSLNWARPFHAVAANTIFRGAPWANTGGLSSDGVIGCPLAAPTPPWLSLSENTAWLSFPDFIRPHANCLLKRLLSRCCYFSLCCNGVASSGEAVYSSRLRRSKPERLWSWLPHALCLAVTCAKSLPLPQCHLLHCLQDGSW